MDDGRSRRSTGATADTVATATKERRGGGERLTMDDPKSKLIDPPYRPVTLRQLAQRGTRFPAFSHLAGCGDECETKVNVKTLLHMRDIGGDNCRRDD